MIWTNDYLPPQITTGERAAMAAADSAGWISPPLMNTLTPEPPLEWTTVHLRYLQMRGWVALTRRRIDGQYEYLLNAEGMKIAAVAALLAVPKIFDLMLEGFRNAPITVGSVAVRPHQ